MSVIITNVTGIHIGGGIAAYIVRINNDPPIASFTHRRADGLAECLRRAAEAVDAARNGAKHDVVG